MCISTRPLTQRIVRSRTWSASLSVGERRCVCERSSSWCQGPIEQHVADDDPARARAPRRLEDHRARAGSAGPRAPRCRRARAWKDPASRSSMRAEDRRARRSAGQAHPLDVAARRHERARPRSRRGTRSPRSGDKGFRPVARRRRPGAWVREPYWHGPRTVYATPAGRLRHHWPARLAQYFVAMATTTSSAIGVPRRRSDGEGKVRGSTRYAADVPVHGLLHARLVLAAEAHGRIDGIDGSAALDVPGVVAVLTAADLPFVAGAAGRAGQPLARSEVVYSGQPVALVVAETEAAAADGVDEVVVDIEPLDAALDLESSMAPGAARARVDVVEGDGADVGGAHAAAGGGDAGGDEEELSDNVAGRQRMSVGDAEAALAGGTARAARALQHELDPPGLHGAAGGHRVARARGRPRGQLEHAGCLQHAPAAGRPARLAARPRARARGAAGRRLRGQAHDRRAVGGRRLRAPRAPRPPGPDAHRGLRGVQPGARRGHRARGGRDGRGRR